MRRCRGGITPGSSPRQRPDVLAAASDPTLRQQGDPRNDPSAGHMYRRTRASRRCISGRGLGLGTCFSGSTTRGVQVPRSPSCVTKKEATSAASRAASGAVPAQTSPCHRERTNWSSSSRQVTRRSARSVGNSSRGAGRVALVLPGRCPLAGFVAAMSSLPSMRIVHDNRPWRHRSLSRTVRKRPCEFDGAERSGWMNYSPMKVPSGAMMKSLTSGPNACQPPSSAATQTRTCPCFLSSSRT